MKKILVLLMVVCLGMFAVACGKKKDDGGDKNGAKAGEKEGGDKEGEGEKEAGADADAEKAAGSDEPPLENLELDPAADDNPLAPKDDLDVDVDIE